MTGTRTAPPGDLSFQSVSFRYPGAEGLPALSVLTGASFTVPECAAGVMLGAADAGKTTLMRVLSGLVPRFTGGSLAGSASFGDLDLLSTRPFDAMDTVGLVFQDPDEQLLTTRCDSEVAFALESLGVPRADMEGRIAGGLGLMGLLDMRGRNPGTLSGGEKKRLLVACLAALDPRLWILDEVFQELDHSWRLALLRHLRERDRTALFFDSRWSALYGAQCAVTGVLSGGLVRHVAPGAAAEQPPGHALLVQEGLVLPWSEPGAAPSGPGEPCLKAQGISFRFPGSEAFELSVDDLSLDRGVLTAIVGRNGSGKSTLGKLLCGLLAPATGSVALRKGTTFVQSSARQLQRRVGYLFQNPDYQVFLPTVAEELALGLRGTGIAAADRDARVEEAINLFRLPPGGTPPALMSYGARRRLQAATYHLLVRDLLILDEIDSGLGYLDILALLPALAAGGAGIVLITHDMTLARHAAARVLVMEAGRIAQDLTPSGFASLERLSGRE